MQLVKPNVILSEFDLKDVDWSENFTILGTVFGSFSTYCKESEIQNFHFYPATGKNLQYIAHYGFIVEADGPNLKTEPIVE